MGRLVLPVLAIIFIVTGFFSENFRNRKGLLILGCTVALISFYRDLEEIWEEFQDKPTPDVRWENNQEQNQQCDRITQLERSLQEHPGVFN